LSPRRIPHGIHGGLARPGKRKSHRRGGCTTAKAMTSSNKHSEQNFYGASGPAWWLLAEPGSVSAHSIWTSCWAPNSNRDCSSHNGRGLAAVRHRCGTEHGAPAPKTATTRVGDPGRCNRHRPRCCSGVMSRSNTQNRTSPLLQSSPLTPGGSSARQWHCPHCHVAVLSLMATTASSRH
jgi:hypothetical protein